MLSRAAGRLLRSVLLVGAASAALSLAGPDALVPFRDAAASAATVGVAFVIDFGSGAPVVGCVQVPPSDNGYYALAAFAGQEHLTAPTYNSAGLLCSIGGVPASGCGQAVPGGYDYWSYWHGATGTWVYSEVGAFATVQSGDVEGWRYEDPGHANPGDPTPGATPDYAAICPAVSQASPPANPSASSAGTGTAPDAPPSGGTSSSGSAPAPAPAGSTATTPPVTAPVEHAATTNGGRPGTAAPRSAAGTTTTTTAGPSSGAAGRTQALGASHAPSGGGGSGGSPAPLVIGGVLIAALALTAGWRWRRRPRTP